MKKILSHHVFSMNFAAIFGLPTHANKPIDELVKLLIGRTKEVLDKLEFVPGNLALQDQYDIQVNATKPYVMGKLLHILNDWDSYLTDYLQTDFTFNLIYDAEVNSRLKCGLQTIQGKEALTELGAYLETTLAYIQYRLPYVINILNQFNSLSDYIMVSKKMVKKTKPKILQILRIIKKRLIQLAFQI